MADNFCILVQGPSAYIDLIRENLMRCNVPIIFSIWEEDKNKYMESDILVLNKKPEHNGVGNINLQMTTTLNGLFEAKKLGYNRVLKLRSDMLPKNPSEFIKMFDKDGLIFFCWHYTPYGPISGYMVDYFMCGNVDDLIKIWSINNLNHSIAEVIMTNNIINHLSNSKMSFVMNDITESNDIHWLKYNTNLSRYKNVKGQSYFNSINLMTNDNVIKEYKEIFN